MSMQVGNDLVDYDEEDASVVRPSAGGAADGAAGSGSHGGAADATATTGGATGGASATDGASGAGASGAAAPGGSGVQGSYVAIEATGFRDFYLKPELIRAINDAGFEHPSEVQSEAMPAAVTGSDMLVQAKSGMGKTAVFVLSVIHQLSSMKLSEHVYCLVIAHTRELALQIKHEFDRFRKYLRELKTDVVYGGVPVSRHVEMLTKPETVPHILIGSPGRLVGLMKGNHLDLSKVSIFVLDECDKCLERPDMRKDVQSIFTNCPVNKQVMMFSATMNSEIKSVCKKFMKSPVEVCVDDEAKLTLHGLLQYYIKLTETQKNRILSDLLDHLEFNQVIIFVKTVSRANALDTLLNECGFPSIAIHAGLSQEDRIDAFNKFKKFEKRLMVATDLFGRGIDIERVNIVINYDMPDSTDSYLHRVGRAGRFGTKGLAITFVANEEDSEMLNEVQSRFEVKVGAMPEVVDPSSYITQ